jgi:FkbM family methyltransferase
MNRERIHRIFEKFTLKCRLSASVFRSFDDDHRRTGLHVSFSQRGEDLLALALLRQIGVSKPTYVDVGANHPTKLSNTYLMYLLGGRGMLIEPDPEAAVAMRKIRPLDTIVNAGVAQSDGEMDFFVMTNNVANTFSRTEAEELERRDGNRIKRILRVPVRNLQSLLQQHRIIPDFLSVDVEGMDLEILQTINWNSARPKVVCVETIDYFTQLTRLEIKEFLEEQGYAVRADTHINSIFIDTRLGG